MRSKLKTRSWLVVVSMLVALVSGCSVKKIAVNQVGNALAGSGTVFAGDDDPEFVKEAAPFSLKLMESLLAETPEHEGLLLAATSGFVQYSYAFIQQDAERMEEEDYERSEELVDRARRMYLRARGYGLRGLEVARPGFGALMKDDPLGAVALLEREDVPVTYWTAVAWGAAISVSKDDPELIVEQPKVEAMIDRVLELDETFGDGAIHTLLIAYELARQGAEGDPIDRARSHFERAMEISKGQQAAPLVGFAESVAVQTQDRKLFVSLLEKALAIDPDAIPEMRLMNMVMQRRAQWLLSREDDLFLTLEDDES